MESMRNLSTSLPTSGRRRTEQPELLSEFKAAALSVTNLFKAATSAQAKARSSGYQDALDDLLAFLDRENLGLMDGEGWRVRQWATERLDGEGAPGKQSGADEEDELVVRHDDGLNTRSSSPEAQRKSPPAVPVSSSHSADESSPPRRVLSEPPALQATPAIQYPSQLPTTHDFTFRSTHAYPTNHDREGSVGMELDASSSSPQTTASTPSSTGTVRILPRSSRSRHTNHNRHRENGGRTINLNLASGAGGKRKMPYPDFFDISGMEFDGSDSGRDGKGGRAGGGKRGRHV
ncbi:hypothetical protein BAUCODRAFT_142984 [Baudoinia panamericana UAMH 10762]|uniref:Uncharacterized protein n=1 Tax=Baudoinia panamericana (strain UAMH 10762) TaxID=717646 RepID=M2MM49_BAUPA|nr:uncharacterized protein BAUCODRAFT_142984 [Baudoinia panamericana UAMH 10762]EMC92448.1 hypothetical protein BAUCODRAFT_142984 [Baudoinia panamericana UAMH 10762]